MNIKKTKIMFFSFLTTFLLVDVISAFFQGHIEPMLSIMFALTSFLLFVLGFYIFNIVEKIIFFKDKELDELTHKLEMKNDEDHSVFENILNENIFLKERVFIQSKAIEIANVGITEFYNNDFSCTVCYVNDEYLNITGKGKESVLGESSLFIKKIKESASEYEKFSQSLSNYDTYETTIQDVKNNGTSYWNNIHILPIFNKENCVDRFLAVHIDITEICNAENFSESANLALEEILHTTNNKLESSQNRMKAVFKSAIDGMFIANDNEELLDINESALKMFGYEKENIIGKRFSTLLEFSDDSDMNLVSINYITQTQLSGETIETTGKSCDNEIFPLSIHANSFVFNNERFYFGTLRDISVAKVTEYELNLSKKHLQKILHRLNLATEAGGIGIWNWSFITNELEWDDRMYSLYDIDKEDSLNNYEMWRGRVLPEDVDTAENELALARETLSQFNSEFRIRLKSGEVHWIKAAADVIFDEDTGEAVGMGGVNIDITKEKNAQEFLRQESEIAQAANEAKSMFLANMSHEIRTPMNGVVGMVSLLHETDMNQDQQIMVSTIRDSALTLLNIINDILDFSKIEAGQMSLEIIPVDFQLVVERTADVLWLQANNKNISIYITHDPKIPQTIMSDGVRLSQILINVLGNAVKFCGGDEHSFGEIWLKTYLNSQGDKDSVDIIIADNGIGMTKKQLSKLFTAFTQADTSTTRMYGGTGLGLSITKTLLEMMGGTISVKSEIGMGSTFKINVPIETASLNQQESNEIDLSSKKILCIYSDANLKSAVQENLEYYECELSFVTTIDKAEVVLCHAKNEGEAFDMLLLCPEYSLDDIQERKESHVGYDAYDDLKVVSMTNNPSKSKGIVKPNSYILAAHPLKPSNFINAIASLFGICSPNIQSDSTLKEALLDSSNDSSVGTDAFILVAEDQPTNRDVLQRQLTRLGYRCEMANDGKAALNKWKKGEFDLILTDCHMPIMDGFELTKEVRLMESQDKSLGHTPVIAITANALVGSAEQCIASGMDDYLSKPVELSELGKALQKWIRQASLTRAVEGKEETQLNHKSIDIAEAIDNSPINLSKLNDILGTLDDEVIIPLLEGYWESVCDDFDKLKQALDLHNSQELQELAHAAKGAANSAGADALAEQLLKIQNTATQQEWDELSELYAKSVNELEKIKQYLQQESII
ncbi:PAS domain S-box protein [Marinomonas sp. PE14-40]|uniref:PAS domain S-box protein n=1 Tax=Marinomonas sp. PE14-40 TaxID=3060621 RepID=UPI003F67BF1E